MIFAQTEKNYFTVYTRNFLDVFNEWGVWYPVRPFIKYQYGPEEIYADEEQAMHAAQRRLEKKQQDERNLNRKEYKLVKVTHNSTYADV
jgi:hypothetical protein